MVKFARVTRVLDDRQATSFLPGIAASREYSWRNDTISAMFPERTNSHRHNRRDACAVRAVTRGSSTVLAMGGLNVYKREIKENGLLVECMRKLI